MHRNSPVKSHVLKKYAEECKYQENEQLKEEEEEEEIDKEVKNW